MANSPQIEFLPEPGMDVRQLFILLHGVGGTPDSLLPRWPRRCAPPFPRRRC